MWNDKGKNGVFFFNFFHFLNILEKNVAIRFNEIDM